MNALKRIGRRDSARPMTRCSLVAVIALFFVVACGQDQSSEMAQSSRSATSSSGSGGCQGQNFVKSREIVEVAWLGGLQIADYMFRTDDMMGGINRLILLSNNLNAEAERLPYACQALIRAWSDQIGQAFGGGGGYSGGTNCMSGVCCDSTGCY